LILSFLPLFRQSLMTVPKEPFHWDVALVQSTSTADEPVQTADTTKSAVPKQLDRIATVAHPNRSIRQAAPSAERIISLDPKTETPVIPTSMPDSPSSVISPSETATTLIPNELPPAPSQATELSRQQTETPIDPTTVVAAGTETHSPTTEPARPSPLPATTSDTADTAVVSATRLDYGWLQQAIFRRLEELKRSSRPFLDQSQPLKVMVKAVVSREGTLLDSSVAKSSGLDHIDQEAMALVQRAFPMQLDRTLDRQQIVMRIPITYSRE
jgi:protein TonB